MHLHDIVLEQCSSDKAEVKGVRHDTAIHYIISGKGYFNGMTLGKGQGFVCLKNTAVSYIPDKKNPWKYLWICFDDENADAILKDANLLSEDCTFNFDYSHDILKVYDYVKENKLFSYGNELRNEAIVKMFLSYHKESVRNKNITDLRDEYVLEAKEFIMANIHRKFTVKEVSDHLHLSRAYFRNVFFEKCNISPQEYILSTRLKRAKELLEMNMFSISFVAHSVGYDDALQFSKIFKKHMGISPRQYAKQNVM
ncbi:MAG: AraC family transcriptional regulator [Clostridia bacterium]|nr:AraC family transcriptional regulator [Clostridia bacterium]